MAEKATPELDFFSRAFPLPYRIAFLGVLGVWAWGANLHCFSAFQIDIETLIKYNNRATSAGLPPYLRVYRLAAAASVPLVASLLFFWSATRGNHDSVRAWDSLPQSILILLPICFVLPIRRFSMAGRHRLLTVLARVSVGGIAEAQEGKFGDILLADALTSYARVLGDLFVTFCMFFSSAKSSTALPDRTCGGTWVVPLIVMYPSLIRLRQCLVEYSRVSKQDRSSLESGSSSWGGQHLANALKYSSAIPVVILSAVLRLHKVHGNPRTEAQIHRLWLFSIFVNSLFSFYWDVAKDWDLTLFSKHDRSRPEHAWALRRRTVFRWPSLYYFVIAINFLLRFSWVLTLHPRSVYLTDVESGVFIMMGLEIFRRWLWAFLRVEAEWIRFSQAPSPEMVPLHTYSVDSDKSVFD